MELASPKKAKIATRKRKRLDRGAPPGGGEAFARRRGRASLLRAELEKPEGDQAGDDREGEDRPHALERESQQQGRDERSDHGAGVVHGPVEPVGEAAPFRLDRGGDHRIPRRGAHALSDSIEEPDSEHRSPAGRGGKKGSGENRSRVAPCDERFAAAFAVGEPAEEALSERSGGFRDSLDDADRGGAGPERDSEKRRQ